MKALLKRFVREEEGQDLIRCTRCSPDSSPWSPLPRSRRLVMGVNGVYGNINGQVHNIPGAGF